MQHTETKPFFLTTEFAVALAALAGLVVTTASSDTLDAGIALPLATALTAAFVFGRGFAKSGAPSMAWDPRETLLRRDRTSTDVVDDDEKETQQMSTVREDYGAQRGPMMAPRYGYGRGYGMREQFPIETKPFFLTSEFWGTLALIAGLAIAAGTSETLDARLFWTLATGITAAYVLSRGIAKSGTKSRAWDPREDLLEGMRDRTTREN